MENSAFIKKAVNLAEKNVTTRTGGPFGAVVVKEGKIIAKGQNHVTLKNDPTAHAEVEAIRKACQLLDTFDLSGCELYTSCEPCPMCLSAIYWARLDAVYYATEKEDAADAGFDDAFIYDEIAKAPADRTIKMVKLEIPAGNAPFEKWKADPLKIEY